MLPRPSGRFVHLMQSCRDPEGVHAAAAGTEPGGSRRHSLARAELQVSSKDLRVDERLSRAMPESNSVAMLPYGSIWVIHGARRSELMGSCEKKLSREARMSCYALVSFYMLWVGVTQTRRRLLFKHWGSTTPEEEPELFRRSCGIGKDGDGDGGGVGGEGRNK